MNFKSKTEAYSYIILLLTQLNQKVVQRAFKKDSSVFTIKDCIHELQRLMENHEQDLQCVAVSLDKLMLSDIFIPKELELLKTLKTGLLSSDYCQSIKEKYENPLARRMESEIAIALLQHPTSAMMVAVKKVSKRILLLINQLDMPKGQFKMNYLRLFTPSYHVISFGAEDEPSVESIKEILNTNRPEQLAEIMHVHYKFAQGIFRNIPIKSPARQPVGKLAEIVNYLWDEEPEKFFSKGLSDPSSGALYRRYISDNLLYESSLYKALANRGKNPDDFITNGTQQLGLMRWGQEEHEVGLAKHQSVWVADCKAQGANLNSQYVRDLVENDAVYISGPSGMTSVLLGQMEILANFKREDLKKHYLTAIMSYIVAPGFHSIHEVIGPAQYALELVPGYKIHVPQQGKLAPPPNYNHFFMQQAAIDKEFALRRDFAWQNYLRYFHDQYVPKYLPQLQQQLASLALLSKPAVSPVCTTESKTLGRIDSLLLNNVKLEMSRYINARGRQDGALSFISKVFRNSALTRDKLLIAIEFNTQLNLVQTLNELKILVNNTVIANLAAEEKQNKTYGIFTKSGLNRSLDQIKAIIKEHEVASRSYLCI